jgi:hypothetical protein
MDKQIMDKQIILLDDVHLEGRTFAERDAFREEISLQIKQIKDSKKIPIVVCSGDIGEGITGVEWVAQLESEVVYVCGNHEFWGQDFYQTINDIKDFTNKEINKHIHFLYNETIVLHDIRFIGTTLWTDMGESLPWLSKNYIIKNYPIMGDFKKITAKNWFSKENEVRLKEFLNYHGIDDLKINNMIENKQFNPLLEKEENSKAINFLIESLGNKYEGKTIVISHHLPLYEIWFKQKHMLPEIISGEFINNERRFHNAAIGDDKITRDILMMGYYANNLKNIMYTEFSPDFWFHGHFHEEISEIIGKTHIVSSPVGYKKQSEIIKYKIIKINNKKDLLADYIKKEIENYDWNKALLGTLRELEGMIKKFEIAINTGLFTAFDFESILLTFQKSHANNLKEFKIQVNNWLKLFVYNDNKDIFSEDIDFFITIELIGILKMNAKNNNNVVLKYKFPELLAAAINENSFVSESKYINKNNIQYYHYKEWLRELQKIQIDIGSYKKMLLNFTEWYRNS